MKTIHKVLLIASIFLISCTSPTLDKAASEVRVQPAMWLATNKQSKVYLLGSVHVLPSNVKWYGDRIEEAFETSDVLIVESLQDEMTDEKYMVFSEKYGLLPDGGLISDYLTIEEYKVYLELSKELGLDRYTTDRMKPWLFLMTIDAILNENSSQYGVDTLLEQEAIRRAKELKSLESIEEALMSLASESLSEGIQKLKTVLNQQTEDKEDEERELDLFVSWSLGDTERVAQIVSESMTPHEYDTLIIKRNTKWYPKIKKELNSDKTTMIVAGLAHFVGKGNIIEKLKRNGYQVKRIQ